MTSPGGHALPSTSAALSLMRLTRRLATMPTARSAKILYNNSQKKFLILLLIGAFNINYPIIILQKFVANNLA